MVISRLHSLLTLGVAELTIDEWKCDRYLIIIAVLAWQILACLGKIITEYTKIYHVIVLVELKFTSNNGFHLILNFVP